MDTEEIENTLLEMTLGGLVNAHSEPGGKLSYNLSKEGLTYAEKLLGGKGIGTVASGLVATLVQYGDAIGSVPDTSTPSLWLQMVQIARMWKEYHNLSWEDWVSMMQQEVIKLQKLKDK